MFRKKTSRILEKYAPLGIVKSSVGANFFGQESLGVKQIRGNGVLLLTSEELIFELWLPNRILRIPISNIRSIEETKWHLKKTKGVKLLKVVFTNEKYTEDSAAWWVTERDQWTQLLKNLIQGNKK